MAKSRSRSIFAQKRELGTIVGSLPKSEDGEVVESPFDLTCLLASMQEALLIAPISMQLKDPDRMNLFWRLGVIDRHEGKRIYSLIFQHCMLPQRLRMQLAETMRKTKAILFRTQAIDEAGKAQI